MNSLTGLHLTTYTQNFKLLKVMLVHGLQPAWLISHKRQLALLLSNVTLSTHTVHVKAELNGCYEQATNEKIMLPSAVHIYTNINKIA